MTRSRPTPLRSKLARCLQYKQPWRRPCRRRRHINISEVRAVALAMDSLGALGKGRSSSAHVLRSAEKPADNGTRDVPCASPLRSCQAEPRRPADREQRHAGADFCEPGASGFFCWQYTVAAGRELDLSKRGFLDLYSGSFGAARALAALSSTGTVPRTFSAVQAKLLGGAFYGVGAGPVCSLSRAIRPPEGRRWWRRSRRATATPTLQRTSFELRPVLGSSFGSRTRLGLCSGLSRAGLGS